MDLQKENLTFIYYYSNPWNQFFLIKTNKQKKIEDMNYPSVGRNWDKYPNFKNKKTKA